jgi:hypothetical protein
MEHMRAPTTLTSTALQGAFRYHGYAELATKVNDLLRISSLMRDSERRNRHHGGGATDDFEIVRAEMRGGQPAIVLNRDRQDRPAAGQEGETIAFAIVQRHHGVAVIARRLNQKAATWAEHSPGAYSPRVLRRDCCGEGRNDHGDGEACFFARSGMRRNDSSRQREYTNNSRKKNLARHNVNSSFETTMPKPTEDSTKGEGKKHINHIMTRWLI